MSLISSCSYLETKRQECSHWIRWIMVMDSSHCMIMRLCCTYVELEQSCYRNLKHNLPVTTSAHWFSKSERLLLAFLSYIYLCVCLCLYVICICIQVLFRTYYILSTGLCTGDTSKQTIMPALIEFILIRNCLKLCLKSYRLGRKGVNPKGIKIFNLVFDALIQPLFFFFKWLIQGILTFIFELEKVW